MTLTLAITLMTIFSAAVINFQRDNNKLAPVRSTTRNTDYTLSAQMVVAGMVRADSYKAQRKLWTTYNTKHGIN